MVGMLALRTMVGESGLSTSCHIGVDARYMYETAVMNHSNYDIKFVLQYVWPDHVNLRKIVAVWHCCLYTCVNY